MRAYREPGDRAEAVIGLDHLPGFGDPEDLGVARAVPYWGIPSLREESARSQLRAPTSARNSPSNRPRSYEVGYGKRPRHTPVQKRPVRQSQGPAQRFAEPNTILPASIS